MNWCLIEWSIHVDERYMAGTCFHLDSVIQSKHYLNLIILYIMFNVAFSMLKALLKLGRIG